MRSYNQQQQLMQMQQHNSGIQQQQQQAVDSPMYPTAIPSATQRTPGMSQPMMPSQVRGMMMPGYNANMMSSSGDFIRARAPGPVSPAYASGAPSFPQPANQSVIVSFQTCSAWFHHC